VNPINSALIPIPVVLQQSASALTQNDNRSLDKPQPEKRVVPASVADGVLERLSKRRVAVTQGRDEDIDGLGFHVRKALSAYSAQEGDMEREEISRVLGVDEYA